MGDLSPPTAADYAWNAALDAQRDNKSLERRVSELEGRVAELERLLALTRGFKAGTGGT